MIRRRETATTAILALVFATAPTVGDIGSCGTTPTYLDIGAYEATRKMVDCTRCTECGLSTMRCMQACDSAAAPEAIVPSTCHPLLHDGEVCIRALDAASCSDYASYVSDVAPTAPTECEFCRDVGDTEMP